ncbi:MAG: transposase [Coleofasciculus chthonoplastes F3-SA18-01]|uniref:transposase n=1 Tax=Coleofasciculus chthonoplastes TaxID=64178 RepID=UPI0032FE7D43
MKYNPQKHHRRSIRLKGYDYTQTGAYFITVCTWQRQCLLGEIINGEMQLSRYGEAVKFNWDILPKRYDGVRLDAFIIMPNHVHGIIFLHDWGEEGAGLDRLFPSTATLVVKPAPTKSIASAKSSHKQSKIYGLPEIVRGFKTFSSRRINQLRSQSGISVWQRGYYEHIIRHEESLTAIRDYILKNPWDWHNDDLHPENLHSWDESSPLVSKSQGKSHIQVIVK